MGILMTRQAETQQSDQNLSKKPKNRRKTEEIGEAFPRKRYAIYNAIPFTQRGGSSPEIIKSSEQILRRIISHNHSHSNTIIGKSAITNATNLSHLAFLLSPQRKFQVTYYSKLKLERKIKNEHDESKERRNKPWKRRRRKERDGFGSACSCRSFPQDVSEIPFPSVSLPPPLSLSPSLSLDPMQTISFYRQIERRSW